MSLENELFSAVVESLGQGLASLQERCNRLDFSFLSSEVEWMGKKSRWVRRWREILAPKSQGATTTCHQQCLSSRTPAERCWFHIWSFSKHSISQLPTLRSSSVCLLKSVHVIPVAHVLSLAGLRSRIMWTLRHNWCNSSYAASSHITSDICKHQFSELTGLVFFNCYSCSRQCKMLDIFKLRNKWLNKPCPMYLPYSHLIRSEFYSRNQNQETPPHMRESGHII